MRRNHPTPGKAHGKQNPNVPTDEYVVTHDLPHGTKIRGHHPRRGQIVSLTANEARHLLLDGIIERAPEGTEAPGDDSQAGL